MATRAENAIRMIKLIHEQPRELKVKDLSNLLGVSQRGVYRCLQTLTNVGIPVRSKKGGYELSNGWGDLIVAYYDAPAKREAVSRLVSAGVESCNQELQRGPCQIVVAGDLGNMPLSAAIRKQLQLSISVGRTILRSLRASKQE